ncbi:MAG: hypothetical protein AVW06_03565 [Hadesarchaea archaeon DG-33-1]|nr:MAG: hypothetical protein AVW06_03565 [Hadesarchaea archaeon DG-33-1]
MPSKHLKIWLAVVIITLAVIGVTLIFQGEKSEEPPSLLSMDDAAKIASEHADTFGRDVKEETLELISAELWPVVKEDNYYMVNDIKIIYYEERPQILAIDVSDPAIHIWDVPLPSKVWVVEFTCEGWVTHWAGPEPIPFPTISGFKAVLDAYTGKILERYYR